MGGPVRVMVTEQQLGSDSEPTLQDLSEALITVYGTDFGIHNPTSISRFTDMTRQATAYRAGRVPLAGDLAHVHYPAGGQSLSLGVQDAVNLGWKLAQVVNGTSPARSGSSSCCTTPGRCCSSSVSPAASTSLHGLTGSS
jgi:3-(3-hydroxy-phenyl)propionate hydroxylase